MARYIDVDIAVREAINACNKHFREKGEFLTSLDAVEIAEALDDIPAAVLWSSSAESGYSVVMGIIHFARIADMNHHLLEVRI